MNGTLERRVLPADVECRLRVAGTRRAPRTARRVVEALLAPAGPDLLERVALVVSELVTNACRHARGCVSVHIRARSEIVRVEVTDDGSGFVPRESDPEPVRGSGWGLYLTERLSSRWGIAADDGATSVWCELEPRS